jgi:hypothetical protein
MAAGVFNSAVTTLLQHGVAHHGGLIIDIRQHVYVSEP